MGNKFLTQDGWFLEEMHGSHSIEIVDTIFNVLYFFLIGTHLPFIDFSAIGYTKLTLLAAWIMILRRLPITLLLYRWIPSMHSINDAAFVGWFAPAGVDTILYAMVGIQLVTEVNDVILPIVLFILFAGTIIQGGSVPIFAYFLRNIPEREICENTDDVALDMYPTTESLEPLARSNIIRCTIIDKNE